MSSVVSNINSTMKEAHHKLRYDIGRKFVLEKVIRRYLPSPKTEETLRKASRSLSKYATKAVKKVNKNANKKFEVVVTPEDLCLVLFFSVATLLVYIAFQTSYWLWILEAYSCLFIPAMNTFHKLESEHNSKVGHFLIYWIFWVGLARVLETLIDFRSIFPTKYVLLKSASAILLMHPQFEGIIIISRLLVEYYILPSLGMRERNVKRTTFELKKLDDDDDDNESEPSLVNEEDWKECSDDDGVKVSEPSSDDDCVKVDEVSDVKEDYSEDLPHKNKEIHDEADEDLKTVVMEEEKDGSILEESKSEDVVKAPENELVESQIEDANVTAAKDQSDVDKVEDPKEVINEDNVINEEGVEEKALPVVEEIALNEEDVKKEEESTVVETNEEKEDLTISDIPDTAFETSEEVQQGAEFGASSSEDLSGSDFSYVAVEKDSENAADKLVDKESNTDNSTSSSVESGAPEEATEANQNITIDDNDHPAPVSPSNDMKKVNDAGAGI